MFVLILPPHSHANEHVKVLSGPLLIDGLERPCALGTEVFELHQRVQEGFKDPRPLLKYQEKRTTGTCSARSGAPGQGIYSARSGRQARKTTFPCARDGWEHRISSGDPFWTTRSLGPFKRSVMIFTSATVRQTEGATHPICPARHRSHSSSFVLHFFRRPRQRHARC